MPSIVTAMHSHAIDPLKAAVASVSELYRLDQAELDQIKTDLIGRSFRFHYENNPYYRSACVTRGVHPDDVLHRDDLIRIPLIPIAKFKAADSHELLSKSLDTVEMEMRSTGTSGIPSVSRRCGPTVDVAVLAIYAMYREFFSISDGAGLYVCPSNEEIPEMGMIKALNLMSGLLDTRRFMVNNERFIPEEAITQLNAWQGKFTRHIIGPPFLIHRLLSFLQQTGQRLRLDRGSRIVTLGGWKRFTGQMISRREFNLMCEQLLGVQANAVRDIYALVESNMLAIDDEHQVKHVSPYCHVSVRDMNDLNREVDVGEKGLLAILDPTSLATPGMLLTEDVVRMVPGASPSGRSGQRIEYIMRAPAAREFGCCAVNLERQMDESPSCPVVA
jgi:Acyl-protein synthetase, LuxE